MTAKERDLNGKTVVVTGAGRGLCAAFSSIVIDSAADDRQPS